MDPLISVRDLRFSFPSGTVALDGIDFDLYPGECVALLGANGSGKTTFALHLNGILRSPEASIRVCGTLLDHRTLGEIRRKVGLVFQDADDQVFMPTVIEDVEFGPLNLGLPQEQARKRALNALAATGISDAHRAPYHLSAGEKRRVAIAGVLAMEPEVLVLDEPTTFLDPPGRRDLIHTLRQLRQAKIVVTHDVGFAGAIATRAVFFDRGKIAGAGTVDEVVERFGWESR